MSFVHLFKNLESDYQFLSSLLNTPLPSPFTIPSPHHHKDKQTDRTFLSYNDHQQELQPFHNPSQKQPISLSPPLQPLPLPLQPHNNISTTSFKPSLPPSEFPLQFSSSSHQSSSCLFSGIHLALIQFSLGRETIPYNIYSDTTPEDILDFVYYNFDQEYYEEIVEIIEKEVAKATRKLSEKMGEKVKRERREGKEEREKENREKENTGYIEVVKGEKRVRVGFNERNLVGNLGKVGITNKWSQREKGWIIRAVKKGDRQIVL